MWGSWKRESYLWVHRFLGELSDKKEKKSLDFAAFWYKSCMFTAREQHITLLTSIHAVNLCGFQDTFTVSGRWSCLFFRSTVMTRDYTTTYLFALFMSWPQSSCWYSVLIVHVVMLLMNPFVTLDYVLKLQYTLSSALWSQRSWFWLVIIIETQICTTNCEAAAMRVCRVAEFSVL